MSDATPAEAGGRPWRPKANPWLIAVTVTLAAFMEVLDTTIVNVALPHIAGSLSVSSDDATWALTSYLVANGIVLPISGWLGSVFGRKRYFLICIAMFTVCSFLCGSSESLAMLVIFRLAQGFFGGGLQPNQQSIILDTFEPSQRGKAFGVTAVATIVAPILGPTLGGLITDHASWRWVFFINVPVGILTFFAVLSLVEDPPWAKMRAQKVDFTGIGLIAIGLGSLQIMLDRGEDDDWFNSAFIRTFAVFAFVGIAGAVSWLLYTKKPVVNLRVLEDRNFAVGSVMIAAMGLLLYSSAVIIPQLAQQVLGYTATLAGLVLSPSAFAIIVMIPIVGRLQQVVPTKYLTTVGFIILSSAMVLSSMLTPTMDFYSLVGLRVAQVAGLGFLFVPISTMAYSTLPKEQNSDAAALFTMFRNIAGSIGISVGTALITSRDQVRTAYLSEHLTPLDAPYVRTVREMSQSLLAQGHAAGTTQSTAVGMIYQTLRAQASILAYSDVFFYCGMLGFCIIPLTFLPRATKPGAAKAHME